MCLISKVIEQINHQLPQIECRLNEPMAQHTSFRIGGPIAALLLPKTTEDVTALTRILFHAGIRPLIIGNGSNLLVEDRELELIGIKTNGLTGISYSGDSTISADCGVLLSQLAVSAAEHGLTGLEFAHGIPGTLGGAIVMNAGAYGGEMKNVVIETVSIDEAGQIKRTVGNEHDFSYRHSRFSDSPEIILSAVLRLEGGDTKGIRAQMDEYSKKRRASQPLNQPSAGSTFKRPKDGYAASLIDQAGLKGYTVGGAMVSEKHAGFVVNIGNATFTDVQKVMEHVIETVQHRFGITLEPEVKIIRQLHS